MQKAFDLIVEKARERGNTARHYLPDIKVISVNKLEQIVNRVAEEYKSTDTSTEEVCGWIPCDERYPSTDEYILLSFENFSTPAIGRWEEDDEGGAFYIGNEDETCVQQSLFVIAWQPLPAPYQLEGE